jgi:hypothetical protein
MSDARDDTSPETSPEVTGPEGPSTPERVQIRRAPKYPVFLTLGGLVGLIGTFIVTALFPLDPGQEFGPLFGYFCVYGIPLGVVLGGFLALLLDRRSRNRSREVTAERVSVDAPEPADGADGDAAGGHTSVEYEATPIDDGAPVDTSAPVEKNEKTAPDER